MSDKNLHLIQSPDKIIDYATAAGGLSSLIWVQWIEGILGVVLIVLSIALVWYRLKKVRREVREAETAGELSWRRRR